MLSRLVLLALFPLAACAAPADPPEASDGTPGAPTPTRMSTVDPEPPVASGAGADTPEARARAAGLSTAQARDIAALRAPVALPSHMEGWDVYRMVHEGTGGNPSGVVGYSVRWRRADGACVEVLGSNDGLGGPGYPMTSARVRLSGMPGAPEAALYKAADDPAATSAQNWGPGTIVSDYVETGEGTEYLAVWLISTDEDGCTPLALDEAAEILARLRPLHTGDGLRTAGAIAAAERGEGQDPFWSDPELGDFAFDDGPTGDAMQGEPVEAVRAWMSNPELDDADIRVLARTSDEVRVLATRTDLPDDSVRGMRTLFVFRPGRDGRMQFFAAGYQVRCWQGRGHQGWSPADCL